ncbi:hypothetical protein [Desulfobacter hydrogenophilus]|nr:hypothetical protein [Desulfobacter hydrogenophilus]NDY74100.1 hypothetical protein [Desulfobacter hydrogenophilus]QBH14096.1 hypothetical protein EYB58_14900 [Desulfobacter hydrogenophilus]
MCMLIVLFFDQYVLYRKNRMIQHAIYAVLFLMGLLLFRPFLIFLCLAGVFTGLLLERKKGLAGALSVIIFFSIFVALYSEFNFYYNKILKGGDIAYVLETKESMVKGGVVFTYMVNILAQLIGPLPTLSPDISATISFFSAGLLFRVLLGFFFWMGVFYCFKNRVNILYSLIFYALIEMSALVSIIEGLELRKSLSHFFVFYIVAFWFLDKYDLKSLVRQKYRIRWLFNIYAVVAFFIVIAWNWRVRVPI